MAQSESPLQLDSLKRLLTAATTDTGRVILMSKLASGYGYSLPDSSLYYISRVFELSQKANYTYGKFLGYRSLFSVYNTVGDYPKVLESQINALKVAEQLPNRRLESMAPVHMSLGFVYREMNLYRENITQHAMTVKLQEQSGKPMSEIVSSYTNTSISYLALKLPDSAWYCVRKGYDLGMKAGNFNTINMAIMGTIEEGRGDFKEALATYHSAIELHEKKHERDNNYYLNRVYNSLAKLHLRLGNIDSCIFFGNMALSLSQLNHYLPYVRDAAKILSQGYETKHEQDSVVKFLKIMIAANDSVYNYDKLRQFQNIGFSEEQRQREITLAEEKYQNQVKYYLVLSALVVFLLIAFILYRNNRQKQQANLLLREQKQEIEKSLANLKVAQTQLIRAEKMASLGELTAGIAHEIQNPLNFVNNFSEVNAELISEMKKEIETGNVQEVKNIVSTLELNMDKITHHGKRADAIVKGMLQHSRKSTGIKEPTDINALADEYLRLCYQGFKARDKSFHVRLEKQFAQPISKVNISPQDMGRVLLNLYSNAFYSVLEKAKQQKEEYTPTVCVSTREIGDKTEICVKDNGTGIPTKIIDKIFQPFFTTKPTGQGTGLGLSLSYDVIKAHGGEIKVDTKEGDFTEFVIQIPQLLTGNYLGADDDK